MNSIRAYNEGGGIGGDRWEKNKYKRRHISREARERIDENQDVNSGSLRAFLENWADAAEERSINRDDRREMRKQMRMSPEELEAYYAERSGVGNCEGGSCSAYADLSPEAVESNLEAAADPDKAWREQQKMDPNYNKLYNRLRRMAGAIKENKERQYDRAVNREKFFDRRQGVRVGDPGEHRMIRNPFYNNINRMLARSADRRQYKLRQRHGVGRGSGHQKIEVSF